MPREADARQEAVQRAGEALSGWVLHGGAQPLSRVIVADDNGKFLYSLEFLVAKGAAILPRARVG